MSCLLKELRKLPTSHKTEHFDAMLCKVWVKIIFGVSKYKFLRPMTTTNLNNQSGNTAVCEHRQKPLTSDQEWARSLEKMKALYQADQQAKFLNLHAETESLLHQLQILKQQREQEVG